MKEAYLLKDGKDIAKLLCLPVKEQKQRKLKLETFKGKLKEGLFGCIDGKPIYMFYHWNNKKQVKYAE